MNEDSLSPQGEAGISPAAVTGLVVGMPAGCAALPQVGLPSEGAGAGSIWARRCSCAGAGVTVVLGDQLHTWTGDDLQAEAG